MGTVRAILFLARGLSSPYTDKVAQDLVRDNKSGRGLLYPDTYAEYRLMFLPPAASALLVLFSRNHNVRFPSINSVTHTFTP